MKTIIRLFLTSIILVIATTVFSQSVVCRRIGIEGFDREAETAKLFIGTTTTSDLSSMKVYLTYSQGYLYAHSNFKTPGFSYPTKIATTEKLDLYTIVDNLVGEGVADRAELLKAIKDKIQFKVDPSVKQYDVSFYKEVTSLDKDGSDLIAKIRARTSQREDERAQQIQKLKNTLKEKSTGAAALFAVDTEEAPTLIRLHFKDDSIHLFDEEIERMNTGQRLSPTHALSKMIQELNGSPLIQYNESTDPKIIEASDRIAFAIQRAYPEAHVFRDPFSDQTIKSSSTLREFSISSPEDLVTLIAGNSFDVKDWNINANLLPALKTLPNTFVFQDSNIPKWTGGSKKAVIVITGHIDKQLENFIDALGNAGYFEGNYVLLNTCRETTTRELASKIIDNYHAISTFSYDSKIDGAAVEGSLFDLIQQVKKKIPFNFIDFIQKIVHSHNLNGLWILCQNDRTFWTTEPLIESSSITADNS